jgi:hypothetical protein
MRALRDSKAFGFRDKASNALEEKYLSWDPEKVKERGKKRRP